MKGKSPVRIEHAYRNTTYLVDHPDGGDWVAEESLLILDMAEAAALALGAQFGQRAIVVGRMGGDAELRWCGE